MSLNTENLSAQAEDNSFWSIVREAVSGSQRDFTTVSYTHLTLPTNREV